MQSAEVIKVSAGLVFRRGKLLITQRRPQDHLGGLWEFPGGKQESGESPEDCLKRELREELGIEVTVGGLLETITHAYADKTVCLKFFLCSWQKHEPCAIGCEAFAWVIATELGGYKFPAADQQLLKRLRHETVLWK